MMKYINDTVSVQLLTQWLREMLPLSEATPSTVERRKYREKAYTNNPMAHNLTVSMTPEMTIPK